MRTYSYFNKEGSHLIYRYRYRYIRRIVTSALEAEVHVYCSYTSYGVQDCHCALILWDRDSSSVHDVTLGYKAETTATAASSILIYYKNENAKLGQ